jgi:hypothetical protein
LLVGEFLGLLFEEELESAFGESLGRSGGDLFHGSEIDVESGPAFAEGAFGNNFAPLGGELSKFLKFLGGEAFGSHSRSCLEVAVLVPGGFPIPPPPSGQPLRKPRRDLSKVNNSQDSS